MRTVYFWNYGVFGRALIIAFSAVIFGLVIASITFWIASKKKRWLAAELVALAPLVKDNQPMLKTKEVTAS